MIAQKSTKDLDLGAETNDDNDMKGLARKADKRTFKERLRGKKKSRAVIKSRHEQIPK